MNEEEKQWQESYMRAQDRVEKIKGFHMHLIAFLVINPFLIFINYMTYWDYKWFWFSLAGWGLGLGAHALVTFGFGNDWEKRKIKELMEQDKYE